VLTSESVFVNLERNAALSFADQLRSAREVAIKDGEAFDVVIHAIERLGSFLYGGIGDLGKYKDELEKLASTSALAEQDPNPWRGSLTPFSLLFDLVKDARNDALHQGAFARHLTTHSINLALRLEDALRAMTKSPIVADYMVRNPVCAELWQPISLIRQQMLTNSFSFIPVMYSDREWRLLSDRTIAAYLRSDPSQRKIRLAESLQKSKIDLDLASFVSEETEITEAVKKLTSLPLLVRHRHDDKILVGILTPFDLL
jgi:hypothetical protein